MPILSGTMMNTSGKVHGKTIIERPAPYAIINQERYDMSWFLAEGSSDVAEKIAPTKIKEKRTKDMITMCFFAPTWADI